MHQLDTYLSNALLSSMRLMEVKKGEYLITQNSQATHLYCLVEGKLQIERYEINGEHVVFSFEQAFCVIGDLELFSAKDEMVFSTVQALVPSYLLALPLSIVRQKALQITLKNKSITVLNCECLSYIDNSNE